jgi:hypothetical protein
MLEISEGLSAFLATQTVFTTAMGAKLSPIVALPETAFPFATYRITEQSISSYDGTAGTVQLYFWYGPKEYKKCAQFTDAMKAVIDGKDNYQWQNSSIDFIEENQSFVGIINFSTN